MTDLLANLLTMISTSRGFYAFVGAIALAYVAVWFLFLIEPGTAAKPQRAASPPQAEPARSGKEKKAAAQKREKATSKA